MDHPRKIATNFGSGAFRALGAGGYLRYLATTVGALPAVLRAGNLRPVDKAMDGIVVLRHPVDRSEVRIDLDAYRPGDDAEGTYAFGLVREIWIRDVYLSLFQLPDRLGCVVDLGANRGIFSLQAAAICERVIAVEPLDTYAAPLARNLDLNGFENLVMVNAMVGGEGLLAPDAMPRMELDAIMHMAGSIPIDLVKIDIEGSEFGLDLRPLRHARRLAMEIHPDWGDPSTLVARVVDLGFECRTFDDSMRQVPAGRADFLLAINRSYPGTGWRGKGHAVRNGRPDPEIGD
jgi:hypothetical protein